MTNKKEPAPRADETPDANKKPRVKKNKKKKKNKMNMALSECVTLCLEDYFDHLGEEQPTNLNDFVLKQVEAPMLRLVMARTSNNQSQAAEILGLNRGTLRKKLKQYDLI
jgi:Fis family transcriptional regulator